MSETPVRRRLCPVCTRPLATCLCDLVRPVALSTQVLVLQHPQELRQVKNSVGLLRLCLPSCEVVVGERFADAPLRALLQRDGRLPVLLYPDVAAAPARQCVDAASLSATTTRLVVIDATWRKSLRLLLEHPLVAALPRLSLARPAPTRYRAIRAARRPDQVSTLEATVEALSQIEHAADALAPVLQAFDHFVQRQQARQARRPSTTDTP